jgi:hypothetical protein
MLVGFTERRAPPVSVIPVGPVPEASRWGKGKREMVKG